MRKDEPESSGGEEVDSKRTPCLDGITISKSDFLDYLSCAASFHLRKTRPDAIEWPAPGEHDRMLMEEGKEVERIAVAWLTGLADGSSLVRQSEVRHGPFVAKLDLMRRNEDGSVDIIEVKSSTGYREHLEDACFQAVVARRSGLEVRAVHVVHVDGDYRREGELDPTALLKVVDVTDEVAVIVDRVSSDMAAAERLLVEGREEATGCDCRLLPRGRHCAAFAHLNADVPELSAYDLPRISAPRLAKLNAEGRLGIASVGEDDVTASQLPTLRALKTGEPLIDRGAIAKFVSSLSMPIAFYDYETCAGAVPQADGHGPYQHIPVQFSCHVLHEDGHVEHHEHLADEFGEEAELIKALAGCLQGTRSAVVWNQTFEKSANRRMARLMPRWSDFLDDLDARTVDLMVPFKSAYVHPDCRGSTSIKSVLPVLCPHLAYDPQKVHDGTGAMAAFRSMVGSEDASERAVLRKELLDYCELDSLAMLEIFRVLANTTED